MCFVLMGTALVKDLVTALFVMGKHSKKVYETQALNRLSTYQCLEPELSILQNRKEQTSVVYEFHSLRYFCCSPKGLRYIGYYL